MYLGLVDSLGSDVYLMFIPMQALPSSNRKMCIYKIMLESDSFPIA